MKIRNPNFKSLSEKRIEFFSVEIDRFIASIPSDVESLSFDDIRAQVDALNLVDADGLAVKGADLTDGIIAMLASMNKIEVMNG